MFWLCEESAEESWNIENLGRQWLSLLDKVIESLEKKKLPHYFVPSHNLLDDKAWRTVKCWIKRWKQIRLKPLKEFKHYLSIHTVMLNFCTSWGSEVSSILNKINLPILPPCTAENYKIKYHEFKQINTILKLRIQMFVVKILLTAYSLQDFLTFVQLYPLDNIIAGSLHAESDEHLIWIVYKELLCLIGTLFKEPYLLLLTSFAEIMQHMVL